jgi:hypothetical protein
MAHNPIMVRTYGAERPLAINTEESRYFGCNDVYDPLTIISDGRSIIVLRLNSVELNIMIKDCVLHRNASSVHFLPSAIG